MQYNYWQLKIVQFNLQLYITGLAKEELLIEVKGALQKVVLEEYYLEFIDLFKEELTDIALLEYKLQNYKIKLKLEAEPVLGPSYALLEKDLGILRKILNKELKKGFI